MITIDAHGNKIWLNVNGHYHRDNDLPAIEYKDGSKEWYVNGKLHRDNDLPAIKCTDGEKHWYYKGKLHRDNDLPAIKYANGIKKWYINGKLHRNNDLPAMKCTNGEKHWYYNGKLHRNNDLPAIITNNIDIEYEADEYRIYHPYHPINENITKKEWYINRKRHRLGGLPAIENINGDKEWYIYDKQFTYEQVINYYHTLTRFGRYCLRKIRINRLRRLKWIHGELLCMPIKGSYPGGQDYHKMVSYFMSM
jgi:hypothetical protein